MTPTRRAFASLLAATAVTGCAAPQIVTRDDKRDPFEGGIGGTGIVGTLTEFGSLKINGLRVELTSRTRILTPAGQVGDGALAPGQGLTVLATRSRDRLVARHVSISYPLVGTVAVTDGGLRVNGVPVVPQPGALGTAVPGQRVAVSGIWRGSRVAASRFDAAGGLPDVIAGIVGRSPTGTDVAGIPIVGESGRIFPEAGSFVTAAGRYLGGVLSAERIQGGRFATGTSGLRQLSVEGYLEPTRRAPGYRVSGLGHSFARDLRLDPLATRRALYFGPYDGLFRATSGYPLPESVPARRALLSEGFVPDLAARAVPI